MRVINEHKCEYLKNQKSSKEDFIAIQEMVQDVNQKVSYKGWYLVNYLHIDTANEKNIAFGIRCCPYCGCLLRED